MIVSFNYCPGATLIRFSRNTGISNHATHQLKTKHVLSCDHNSSTTCRPCWKLKTHHIPHFFPLLQETSTILYDSTSDGISYIKTEVPSSPGSETQCSSPTYDDCTSETDMKPCAPIEESSISDPEYTPTPIREEPWPSTSRESRPPAKRSKKQPEESSSEESKNLLRVISKTLETLASKDDNNDDISAYCKNLERKMRKLPPHILPHFQHEVDTCLYRYLIITSYNHTGQTSGAHLSQHPIWCWVQ